MNFDLDSDTFQNSPMAEVYYAVRNELREDDGKKKSRSWHHRVALWVSWESHKIAAIDEGTQGDLLEMVGLPRTQKEFAQLIGVAPRTVRSYSLKHGGLVEMARTSGVQRVLGRYDLHALHALGMVASLPSPQAASDRRTFFTMRGFFTEKKDVTLLGTDLSKLSLEELEKLASNL